MIRSEDLGPGKPEKVKVLGLNVAVFRNAAGEAITLSDTCVHRGGLLTGTNSSGATTRPRRSRFHRRVGAIEWVDLEAVRSKRVRRLRWRELTDTSVWRRGWH